MPLDLKFRKPSQTQDDAALARLRLGGTHASVKVQ